MKFISIFAALAVFASGVAALSDEDAIIQRIRGEDEAGTVDLLKRSCVKTSCKGTGWSAGLHCGDGYLGCVKGHVYQVASASNVCDYGIRTSCQKCNKLSC